MSVSKQDFSKLVSVQEQDTLLDALKRAIDKVPEDIDALRAELEGRKGRLNAAQETLKAIQLKKKDKELAMAQKEELIRKHQRELNAIKTNDAFKALLKEIDEEKAGVSDFETEILLLMEETDKALKEEKDAKAELKIAEGETEVKVAELQAHKAGLEKQHAEGSAKRKSLLDGIPEELLSLYEETRKRRAGIAIAQVHNNTCTVCHMRVSPQCVINTRKGTTIEMCDSCQRILYDLETSQAKAG
ncbi:MAG: hypothetical protein WC728_06395 [Elusimicrobiota bacterium]